MRKILWEHTYRGKDGEEVGVMLLGPSDRHPEQPSRVLQIESDWTTVQLPWPLPITEREP